MSIIPLCRCPGNVTDCKNMASDKKKPFSFFFFLNKHDPIPGVTRKRRHFRTGIRCSSEKAKGMQFKLSELSDSEKVIK
jgi:hypothetical protein